MIDRDSLGQTLMLEGLKKVSVLIKNKAAEYTDSCVKIEYMDFDMISNLCDFGADMDATGCKSGL